MGLFCIVHLSHAMVAKLAVPSTALQFCICISFRSVEQVMEEYLMHEGCYAL